ncbi:MAG: glycosyltransferase family 4 protein [Acidobacteriia bacterium]|nr:glycosyltransferase family 4 protein [Terriglobia bacterium]
MKVLIYTHAFAPRVGGVETFVMLLAQGLSETPAPSGEKIRVTVATPTPAGEFDDSQLPFTVVRQPRIAELWRLIGAADIVQLAGPAFLPLALALLRGKVTVVEHHGYQARCPNGLLFYEPTKTCCPGHFQARRYDLCLRCNAASVGWLGSARLLLLTFPRRWLCKRATCNVPISHHVQTRLALPRSRVIHYGIPAPAESECADTSPMNGWPVIGYVGRLVSEKGIPVLVEAARRLAARGCTFQLCLVGDGPERASLEAAIAQAGLSNRTQITGFLRDHELQNVVRAIDIVVMPSVCEETAGLAAIEQMMRGRVVVASAIGGLGEVAEGGGIKFPPGDASALADCLEQLLKDPSRRTEIGRRARAVALERYRQERMVADYIKLYRNCLAESSRSAW